MEFFLVNCDSYPQPGNNGTISYNGRQVDSVATVTCPEGSYPSNNSISKPGHAPTNRAKSSSCFRSSKGATAKWNDTIKCIPGNKIISTPDAILVQW